MIVDAKENAKGIQESESYTVNPDSSWRLGCDRSKDGRSVRYVLNASR
jgi:hypothetical protein